MRLLALLRIAGTSAVTAAVGLFNLARSRTQVAGVVLKPGDPAPEFELEGSDGRTYRLSDLRGQPVVLAWFPKAFTGGCTVECRSIAARGPRLGQAGASVFAVSVDTPETNRRFAASLRMDTPILSDPGRSVARAYRVLGATGFPSRWTFYISAEGRILAIDKAVRASTHGEDIERALLELGGGRTLSVRRDMPSVGHAGSDS